MAWSVAFSEDVESWVATLSEPEWQAVLAAIEMLEAGGPALGRPVVDTIKGSGHHNMKELRSVGGHLRVLFAFDPKRQALLPLGGGDKSGDWTGWYERNVPLADDLLDDYLTWLRENPER